MYHHNYFPHLALTYPDLRNKIVDGFFWQRFPPIALQIETLVMKFPHAWVWSGLGVQEAPSMSETLAPWVRSIPIYYNFYLKDCFGIFYLTIFVVMCLERHVRASGVSQYEVCHLLLAGGGGGNGGKGGTEGRSAPGKGGTEGSTAPASESSSCESSESDSSVASSSVLPFLQ